LFLFYVIHVNQAKDRDSVLQSQNTDLEASYKQLVSGLISDRDGAQNESSSLRTQLEQLTRTAQANESVLRTSATALEAMLKDLEDVSSEQRELLQDALTSKEVLEQHVDKLNRDLSDQATANRKLSATLDEVV
jgi:hypothetical protein